MNRQTGFSLIDLMISMVISLVVVGAIGSMYLNMKESFVTQQAQAELQDSARFTGTMMTAILRQAGYIPFDAATVGRKDDIFTAITGAFPAAGQVVSGTEATLSSVDVYQEDGSTVQQSFPDDAISIRFVGGASMFDCLGGAAPDGEQLVERFSLVSSALQCNHTNISTSTTDSDLLVGQNLGSRKEQIRVVGMLVWYGLDTDGNLSVDQYRRANAVNSAGAWKQVKSAAIILTVQSGELIPKNLTYVVHFPNAV
ncbi:MAG TPA: hypothetical protein ENJ84_04375 [Gammaproteobacteria bacterium]|nr:hypothetical protein [Gammaproteobacteria bacterium]